MSITSSQDYTNVIKYFLIVAWSRASLSAEVKCIILLVEVAFSRVQKLYAHLLLLKRIKMKIISRNHKTVYTICNTNISCPGKVLHSFRPVGRR